MLNEGGEKKLALATRFSLRLYCKQRAIYPQAPRPPQMRCDFTPGYQKIIPCLSDWHETLYSAPGVTAARTRAVAVRNCAASESKGSLQGFTDLGKCSELLNPARESCVILSQSRPGKFNDWQCVRACCFGNPFRMRFSPTRFCVRQLNTARYFFWPLRSA